MFAALRKFVLLTVLVVVALSSWLGARNATDWQEPLWVMVYPINGDGRESTASYIDALTATDFSDIEAFMARETKRYGIDLQQPVKLILGERVASRPPAVPVGGNVLTIARWSLELRWWAHRMTRDHAGPPPDIRLFLVYFDPAQTPALEHSVGLEKGRVGVVNVFAARRQTGANNFVIAHEMLHTLGASDKYELPSLLPRFPDGYAEPAQKPLYPQRQAEIMGGRIPVDEQHAAIPESLRAAVLGPGTAREIRLLR
ncbi:MAG: hypothetical protein V2J12_00595 [Gammaproteobacteria bacterium]|nr:hypothetical protein [Gammaproteobacteria bacterium]